MKVPFRFNSETKTTSCGHPKSGFENSEYWYTLLERRPEDGKYWTEHDATYVKLQRVERLYVCKYCGQLAEIMTAEEIGGPENLIRKKDIREGKVEEPPNTGTGGFKNEADRGEIMDKRPLDEKIKEFEENLKKR